MSGFVRILGQKLKVLFIGFVIAGLKFGYRTPLLAGIGRPPSTNNMFIIGIAEAVELSS